MKYAEFKPKRITKATLKSFIRKNKANLVVKEKSSFNGMIDMCDNSYCNANFTPIKEDKRESQLKYHLGIIGVHICGGELYNWHEDDTYIGIEYYNCCGNAIIAVKKELIVY